MKSIGTIGLPVEQSTDLLLVPEEKDRVSFQKKSVGMLNIRSEFWVPQIQSSFPAMLSTVCCRCHLALLSVTLWTQRHKNADIQILCLL